ncbi:GntR family transcriptional regulator [Brevibacterium sp. 91QC2O2]|uniref:GntR family transcriptional regulator n=1 Tax=Brevibacterium TaxID=1696 RepID=UPI00211CDD81|nr:MULTISPECIES: GntR family transcriptional regulator [unclassified Brevibacterium]MCQ9369586.1 GntR family transcriptional regulator [Brevibacterium sp. 91QC2O2]MCQ9386984.1 GntR family transcriptional regulator [Brevibacterium sp. 68QC2CO]
MTDTRVRAQASRTGGEATDGAMPPARALLRDTVYRELRDAIVRGELAPGTRLRDSLLSKRFGTSRTPIREAILRLARAGLVVATPGKATIVAAEDPHRVRWAQQIAAELHALAITLCEPDVYAAETAAVIGGGPESPRDEDAEDSDAEGSSAGAEDAKDSAAPQGFRPLGKTELRWMKSANASLKLAIEAGDAEAAIAADEEFHMVPVRACGNLLIAEQLEDVTAALRRSEYLHFGSMTGMDSPDKHAKILHALKKGKYEKAARLTRENWLTIAPRD